LSFSKTITIQSPGSAPDVYQYIDILCKEVNSKHALNNLTHLLRRPVETAGQTQKNRPMCGFFVA
jgi:hypothetical protein